MSTELSELKKLEMFGDACKQNDRREILANLVLIHSKLSSSENFKPFVTVKNIQDLGKVIIGIISANPVLFCVGFAIGAAVGVGVAIYRSLSEESKSKIKSIVSNCLKNAGSLISRWKKACHHVSQFIKRKKSLEIQNEIINVPNDLQVIPALENQNEIINVPQAIPELNTPSVNGIDLQMLENLIIEKFGVTGKFLSSFINLTIGNANNTFCFKLEANLIKRIIAGTVKNTPFSVSKARMISISILSAIDYLHSLDPPIIHRDIKGGNIFLNDNDEPILGDFGLSYKAINNNTNFGTACGTPFWAPPEILNRDSSNFSRKCDIWSFGCTVLEMIIGGDPWKSERNNQSRSPPIPINLSQECQDVLNEILKYDPTFRPYSKHLLKASWFNETPTIPFSNYKKAINSDEILDSFKKFGLKLKMFGIEHPSQYNRQHYFLGLTKISNTISLNEDDELVKKGLNTMKLLKSCDPLQIEIGYYVLDLKKEFEDFNILESYLVLGIAREMGLSSDYVDCFQWGICFITNFLVYQTIIHRPERFKIV
ncbi:hypothetical protein ACTFIY_000466 [Dictyostelium cf. discoideum]